MKQLHIGTSGWAYKGWANAFYPPDVPIRRQLEFYATQFSTVEINASFYRLPTTAMAKAWHDRAPKGFIYAVKGSRFITHLKKLAVTKRSISIFFRRVLLLKDKLGPILWQLPPMLHKDLPRLRKFLGQLPPGLHYAVEFRHPSWLDPATFELLKEFRVANVSLSSLAMPMDRTLTADFIYVRFHGLAGGFAHDYSRSELKPWAKFCRDALEKGLDVFAYFNNDANVRAPANAKALLEMI